MDRGRQSTALGKGFHLEIRNSKSPTRDKSKGQHSSLNSSREGHGGNLLRVLESSGREHRCVTRQRAVVCRAERIFQLGRQYNAAVDRRAAALEPEVTGDIRIAVKLQEVRIRDDRLACPSRRIRLLVLNRNRIAADSFKEFLWSRNLGVGAPVEIAVAVNVRWRLLIRPR